MPDGSLYPVFVRINAALDARLVAFEKELAALLAKAQDATIDRLLTLLKIEDGNILPTPSNGKVLRRAGDLYEAQADRLGATRLFNAFVQSFPDQLPSVEERLNEIAKAAKITLPKFSFDRTDLAIFKSVAAATTQSLNDVVATEATKLTGRFLFGAGAMPFKAMTTLIRDSLDTTVARAKTLADTSQASFYRVALDRQYQKIQNETKQTLRYRYSGPVDLREREFCRERSRETLTGKSWTRDEIDAMSNGQLPNVFITAGGYNCRHQWAISFDEMLEDKSAT